MSGAWGIWALGAGDFTKLLGALAVGCMLSTGVAARAGSLEPRLDSVGAGESFRDGAMAEFRLMGFGLDARMVDFDEMGPRGDALADNLGVGKAAVFSSVQGAGPRAKCLVGLRMARWANAPERHLVAAGAGGGVEAAPMWRIMARHELGHCALAQLATSYGKPSTRQAEAFADVFALSWTALRDRNGMSLAKGFAAARARTSSADGDHATGLAIDSWLRAGSTGNPCMDAWTAAPLDARPAQVACPASR